MKTTLILTSCLLLFSFVSSTKSYSLVTKEFTITYHKDNGRYSGKYQSTYSKNESLRATGTLLNGKRIGEWIVYDTLGNVLVKRNYLDKNTFSPKLNVRNDLDYTISKGAPITTLYSKRLWREIPTDKNEIIFKGNLVAGALLKLASNNSIKSYSPVNDEFKFPVRYDSLRNVYQKVIAFKIKEDNYYNKYTQLMETQIIGICPVVEVNGKHKDIAWFYFPEFITMLKENIETPSYRTILEIFDNRNFHSFITKESNKNDISLDEYNSDTKGSLFMLRERIEIDLIETEHDLWIRSLPKKEN